MNEETIRGLVRQVIAGVTEEYGRQTGKTFAIPAEVSARHVHLCQEDIEALFGAGYQLKKKRDISQPGQYICEERVTLIGPKGQLANVAVLGPPRQRTQVEVSLTDSRALGISVPVSMSGELKGAADVFIMNGQRMLCAKEAVIAAKNHIHMTEQEAQRLGVEHGQRVKVRMLTARPLTFDDVVLRVDSGARLALHIDVDEANACGYRTGDSALISGSEQSVGHAEAQPEKKGEPRTEAAADLAFSGRLLTEETAVALLSPDRNKKVLHIKKGTIVTPMAMDVIRSRNAELAYR